MIHLTNLAKRFLSIKCSCSIDSFFHFVCQLQCEVCLQLCKSDFHRFNMNFTLGKVRGKTMRCVSTLVLHQSILPMNRKEIVWYCKWMDNKSRNLKPELHDNVTQWTNKQPRVPTFWKWCFCPCSYYIKIFMNKTINRLDAVYFSTIR